MTLPYSGQISLGQLNDELNRPHTQSISLGEGVARTIAGKPTGPISLSDLYGRNKQIFIGAFTSSQWLTIPTGATAVRILAVGGGGGGGDGGPSYGAWEGGGGGGGGAVIDNTLTSSSIAALVGVPQLLTIGTVGGINTNGGNTSFLGQVALGGGGGGGGDEIWWHTGLDGYGRPGGSGGGSTGSQGGRSGGVSTQWSTYGYGFGSNGGSSNVDNYSGGGGGAGAPGSGSTGGSGINVNISGTTYFLGYGGNGGYYLGNAGMSYNTNKTTAYGCGGGGQGGGQYWPGSDGIAFIWVTLG